LIVTTKKKTFHLLTLQITLFQFWNLPLETACSSIYSITARRFCYVRSWLWTGGVLWVHNFVRVKRL